MGFKTTSLFAIPTNEADTCLRSNAMARPIIAVCGHESAIACARKFSKIWVGAFAEFGRLTGSIAAAKLLKNL